MVQLNVLNRLIRPGSRLGLYTHETHESIPTSAGCYAWFLPLWFYHMDYGELIGTIAQFLNFEDDPLRSANIQFTRDQIQLSVTKSALVRENDGYRKLWEETCGDERTREWLQEVFLEASLLMPPLYVGRTDNLQRRYGEHVKGKEDTNDFHARFSARANTLKVKVAVSDLLFACIRTQSDDASLAADQKMEKLIEHLFHRFWHPPFSVR